MEECPLCIETKPEEGHICTCGYNFKINEIEEKQIRIPSNKGWVGKVEFIKRVNEFQLNKYGEKITTKPNVPYEEAGWSQKETARILNKSEPTISRTIKLVDAFEDNPDLKKCKTQKEAFSILDDTSQKDNRANSKLIFEKEKDLHDYLIKNWKEIDQFKEWNLENIHRKGKVDTKEIGEMDILAKHKNEPRWLVIELKKDQSSDETIGQILRYMGWVRINLARDDEKVEGIIISNSSDNYMPYAIMCTSNIELMSYEFEDNKLQLKKHI